MFSFLGGLLAFLFLLYSVVRRCLPLFCVAKNRENPLDYNTEEL